MPVLLVALIVISHTRMSVAEVNSTGVDPGLYESLIAGKVPPHKIRQAALRGLQSDPDDYVAELTVGLIESEAGNYPEAVYRFQRAIRLTEHESIAHASAKGAYNFHLIALKALAEAYFYSNRDEDLYMLVSGAHKSFPETPLIPLNLEVQSLAKMGRFDEALSLADKEVGEPGLASEDLYQRKMDRLRILHAMNPDGLDTYREAVVLCNAMAAAGMKPRYSDLAFYALRQGRYHEARDALLNAAQFGNSSDSPSHPYRGLFEGSLAAADFSTAHTYAGKMWEWMQGKKARVRQELDADTRISIARFYLATGYPRRAEQAIAGYVDHPNRTGYSNMEMEKWQAGVLLLAWSASKQVRILEKATVAGDSYYDQIVCQLFHVPRLWREFVLGRRIRALVSAQIERGQSLRDAMDVADAPVWMWGDLCRVLGSRRFQGLFDKYPLRGARGGYFGRALAAEALFQAGEWDSFISLALEASANLPPEEKLLEARLRSMLGYAFWKTNNKEKSLINLAKACRLNIASILQSGVFLPLSGAESQGFYPSSAIQSSTAGFPVNLQFDGNRVLLELDLKDSGAIARQADLVDAGSYQERQKRALSLILLLSPIGLPGDQYFMRLDGPVSPDG